MILGRFASWAAWNPFGYHERGKKDEVAGCSSQPNSNQNEKPTKTISGRRVEKLMAGLQHILELQKSTIMVQIDARQKHRRVGYQRQEVSRCDDEFMKSVRQFCSLEILKEYEELRVLATRCQAARDELGTLEQVGIDADRSWEGHVLELRQAEEKLIDRFEGEFESARDYTEAHLSSSKSASSSLTDSAGSEHLGTASDERLPGIRPNDSVISAASVIVDADGREIGHEFIDAPMESINRPALGIEEPLMLRNDVLEPSFDILPQTNYTTYPNMSKLDEHRVPQSTRSKACMGLEVTPQHEYDFATSRDRVNKWLDDITLNSHLHSTDLFNILVSRLEKENVACPSNWAQLVVAYWTADMAMNVAQRRPEGGL